MSSLLEKVQIPSHQYQRVYAESSESGLDTAGLEATQRRRSSRRLPCLLVVVVVLFGGLALVLTIVRSSQVLQSTLNKAFCVDAPIRREWRSLSSPEKKAYIDAVQCLRDSPSKLGLDHSLYDDFPWVHMQVGGYAHATAAFLAWHRYFIHVFEQTLQISCGYTGNLAYWDWTLDWQDLTHAPVFGSELAFGSDGNSSAAKFNHGHCVTDGPFANLEVKYFDGQSRPHCLSRGFAGADKLANYSTWISPNSIETVMAEAGYERFNLLLENTGHNAIPYTVNGDFLKFTAPYDPIFFLHHTQLDRLWYKWQQLNPSSRLQQYEGLLRRESTTRASLTDLIPMGGLDPDRPVAEVMDPHAGILCYSYI